jgi:hypothetical protein
MIAPGACALCFAAVAAFDLHEDFEGGDPLGSWQRAEYSQSTVVSGASGHYLNVDEDGSTISRGLGGDRLEADVVFDSDVRFTASASQDVPDLDTDAKFAIWLYGSEDGATNLFVTAGGPSLVADRYSPVNYRIDSDMSSGGWHHVTVRAIHDIGVGMMAFVVFVDGVAASCVDGDYESKLPPISGVIPLAGNLATRRQLFPSIQGPARRTARTLASVDFGGIGALDDLSVVDAESSGLAPLPNAFRFRWTQGVVRFSYRIGGGEIETVDCAKEPRAFCFAEIVEPSTTVEITEVVYDTASGYFGSVPEAVVASVGELAVSATQANVAVGDKVYGTLRDALEAAQPGETVRLLRDVDETWQMYFKPSSPVVLDLAGRRLRLASTYHPLFYLDSDAVGITVASSAPGAVFDASGAMAGVCRAIGGYEGHALLESPGIGRVYESEEAAEAAVAEGVASVALPPGVGAVHRDRYSALFTMVREGATVKAVLKHDGDEIDAVKGCLSEATSRIDLVAAEAGDEVAVRVDAVPGLYYGVSSGESPFGMSVKSWRVATGETVDLPLPGKEEGKTSAFFRIEASAVASPDF